MFATIVGKRKTVFFLFSYTTAQLRWPTKRTKLNLAPATSHVITHGLLIKRSFLEATSIVVLNKSCLVMFFSFLRKRREYYCEQECDQNGFRETAG